MRFPRTVATACLLVLLLAGMLPFAVPGSRAAAPDDIGTVHRLDSNAPLPEPGRAQPRSDRDLQLVIGRDERSRITPTTTAPHKSIAYIEAWDDQQGIGYSCTATFIGPRTLLTAAHCVWIDEFVNGWPDRVLVAAAQDGIYSPYGKNMASEVWVPNGWSGSTGNTLQRFQWDFALIMLPDTQMSDAAGTLELGILSDATLQMPTFQPVTSGYPGDKPAGTQWMATQPSFDRVTSTQLVNSLDAFQGQSGSAIWGANDGRIVGIVSYETRTTNYALRITQRVLDALLGACETLQCSFFYSIEGELDVTRFAQTWARTDQPVNDGTVSRTWIWGPESNAFTMVEQYDESPGGERTVRYFDKSRMEISNPASSPTSLWYVTNGLLVIEMITGNLQTGDNSWQQREPAQVNVAGDGDDPLAPTYASLAGLLGMPATVEGEIITQTIDRNGSISSNPDLAALGVTASHFVPETNHSVASVFWEFVNSRDLVYQNGSLTIDNLFLNPFYATGLPVTEPYWITVKVDGYYRDVLIQAFERRVLTYTPDNPPGWQVEAGNVGQHYYQWRYE
jgi:V8-like Glu-specific endopeptidase